MKLTLPWLKEHLDTDADVETIAKKLTDLGLEVEGVVDPGAALEGFQVAEIVEAARHPQADRLWALKVRSVDGIHSVVCGAPNVRQGLRGILARPGLVIPASGEALTKATIRGVPSEGMMCSWRELKLGDDHDGIIDLPGAPEVGTPAVAALGIEGPVIELKVTPDRADCFGINGIARDLAAAGLGILKQRDFAPVAPETDAAVRTEFDFQPGNERACPLFVSRVIRSVKNGPSPAWLARRLTAIGLRPISALVDITNYLTFDLDRPLHVFDANKLRGHLRLREAVEGETLEGLDGKVHRLAPGMTVICDDSGVISLAGVVGGVSTSCDETTTDVVLEVALFDPLRTAETGRRLGIDSDARARFERGVDPALVLPSTEFATRLIQQLCGGRAGPVQTTGVVPDSRPRIQFHTAQIVRLAGISLERDEIETGLRQLGFEIEGGPDLYDITVPSWRHDVSTEACIVEEVTRLHGYDQIPPVSVTKMSAVAPPVVTPEQRRRSDVRRQAAARGLLEAVTWSFMPEGQARRFGAEQPILLRNPIHADLAAMRPSILPNLLQAVRRNVDRGLRSGGMFELGPRFMEAAPGQQRWSCAGLRFGELRGRHWADPARNVDLFDVKADVLALLTTAGAKIETAQISTDAPGWFHPGRSGRVRLGPQVLASFGEMHPAILAEAGIEVPVVAFEFDLDTLPKPRTKAGRNKGTLAASPFQAVDRDFAFVVAEDVTVEALLKAVRQAEKQLVREVSVFDVYRGPSLGADRKSVAISVRLQSQDRTLDEAAIEAASQRIVASVVKATGAALRS
ncbi:MAG TPA: phenylalanine--tRNA ligase subunit beta [Geminicoccus sp.]|jgi:phenylalanyl-tRNA synthetase beta chain|uniref:phenylalanine--tRNA ligase subunit beta n=1 Tax=Geminicoccus sp. TaxID=2024832 RepID=UPI002E35A140|nr:phenylalanine--tRNA ligase subunit beta [Geminicoccus sp.]HEX2529494.1 phenylalanine--tRNA ligase subunit beta [Geminicoccus sp.]